MELFSCFNHTRHIPHTYRLLQKKLPSILRSTCYNKEKLPLGEEVKNTEIGHLFEHIMLEYLSSYKFFYHKVKKLFNGITSWDTPKYGENVFKIEIDAGQEDKDIFNKALIKSSALLKNILS